MAEVTYPSGRPIHPSRMTTQDLPASTQRAWRSFLETYEPLRADLYRYCHRGRGKLVDETQPEAGVAPVPSALDTFCKAFNAGDLDGLTALLLETAVVQVVGATTQYGPEAAK